jgi:hypothetical protein
MRPLSARSMAAESFQSPSTSSKRARTHEYVWPIVCTVETVCLAFIVPWLWTTLRANNAAHTKIETLQDERAADKVSAAEGSLLYTMLRAEHRHMIPELHVNRALLASLGRAIPGFLLHLDMLTTPPEPRTR